MPVAYTSVIKGLKALYNYNSKRYPILLAYDLKSICFGCHVVQSKSKNLVVMVENILTKPEYPMYLLLKMLYELYSVIKVLAYKPIVVFYYNTGEPIRCRQIIKDYKSHRHYSKLVINDRDFTDQYLKIWSTTFDTFAEYVNRLFNAYCIKAPYYEDDFIPLFILKHLKVAEINPKFIPTCLITTADKDYHQLVNRSVNGTNILLYNWRKGIIIDEDYLVNNPPHIPPRAIALYLAIVGDSSDGIKGIPRIGPKRGKKIIDQLLKLEPDENTILTPEHLIKWQNEIELGRLLKLNDETINTLQQTYRLTSFDEQMDNVPELKTYILDFIKNVSAVKLDLESTIEKIEQDYYGGIL